MAGGVWAAAFAVASASFLAARISLGLGAVVGAVGAVGVVAAARSFACALECGAGTGMGTDCAPPGDPDAIMTERAPPTRATQYLLCIVILPTRRSAGRVDLPAPCGDFAAHSARSRFIVNQTYPQCAPSPSMRISRLPAWLAGPSTPSFSMRSIREAARL